MGVSFAFTAVTGIFFGYYHANKAAFLNLSKICDMNKTLLTQLVVVK